MTLASVIELLKGVFAFPTEILRLINALKSTPEEKHENLLAKMESEAKSFEATGRPEGPTA
jgi:hypothetical protein